jgi:hypothetical protein
VAQLRRESERSRAGLAETVEQIRSKASETAADIRDRLSAESIKAEVGDFVKTRGERLLESARQNPLQAAAICGGLAYPLFGLARAIPAPVLMIGAGLFLMGSKTGQSFSRALAGKAAGAADEIGAGVDVARRRLHDASDFASDQIEAANRAVAAGVDELKHQAANAAGAVSGAASDFQHRAVDAGIALADGIAQAKDGATAASEAAANVASGAQNALDSARRTGAETIAAVRDNVGEAVSSARDNVADTVSAMRGNAAETLDRASATARDAMQRNPLLIGGLGLAVGALIAACLPRSDFEKGVMGEASEAAQTGASALAAQGLEKAKEVAAAAYGAGAQRAEQEGLAPDGLREAAHGLGERMRSVADSATTTAFQMADEEAR